MLPPYYVVFFIVKIIDFSPTFSFEESFLNLFGDMLSTFPYVKGVFMLAYSVFKEKFPMFVWKGEVLKKKGISKGVFLRGSLHRFYLIYGLF